MLERPDERVRLLKAGYSGLEIEELYIKYNNYKVLHVPILFDQNKAGASGCAKSYFILSCQYKE